jgi:hypothetical protein
MVLKFIKNIFSRKRKYVILRCYAAGVFSGYLKNRKKNEVVLTNVRRLRYWSGAATLSQLAMEGVKDPDNCRFPCEVDEIHFFDAIEIISCTDKAKQSIADVKIWKA